MMEKAVLDSHVFQSSGTENADGVRSVRPDEAGVPDRASNLC